MARIAISYRRADSSGICRAIYDRFVQYFGSGSVFIDIDDIPFGENFTQYIASTLKTADVLLVLVGPNWTGSRDGAPARIHDVDDPVRTELETAAAMGMAILPVLVHRARMPLKTDLPVELQWFPALNAAEVDEGRNFDTHIAALVEAVERRADGARKDVQRDGEPPNNLPIQLSSFIGRKSELKQLLHHVRNKRVVSIVGPAGVGKTRLALHVASTILAEFPGGAWYVPISETLAIDVAVSVANAMNLDILDRDPSQAIFRHVSGRPALLILDESEHQLPAIAVFVKDVLRHSSCINVLVTSRERLHLAGEQVLPLLPLQLPHRGMTLEEIRRCDSLRLLTDRANTSGTAFQVTDQNVASVVAICERLDGIPLALEFAAARLPMLSPSQILERLHDQFALLVGDKHEENRHRTLRTAIEWSYDLLDDNERALFPRLGIFHNAFGLNAVEAICADERIPADGVLDALTSLVDKSFVTKESAADTPCFRLLHVIRAFALERLDECSGRGQVEEARFNYFSTRIARYAVADDAGRAGYIDEFSRSSADIFSSLTWGLHHKRVECVEHALTLRPFWSRRGLTADGAQLLEAIAQSELPNDASRAKLLLYAAGLRDFNGEADVAIRDAEAAVSLCETTPARAQLGDALLALGAVKLNGGDYGAGRDLMVRAIPMLEETRNVVSMTRCLVNLSLCDTILGDYDGARKRAREAVELCERNGDMLGASFAHSALAQAALHAGTFADARIEYKRALEILRPIGHYYLISNALSQLAEVELLDGDTFEAERNLKEGLELICEHDLVRELPDALEAAARLLAFKQCDKDAAQLFGAVDTARKQWRVPIIKTEKAAREAIVRGVIDRHSRDWFDTYYTAGLSLDVAAVLQLAKRAVANARNSAHGKQDTNKSLQH